MPDITVVSRNELEWLLKEGGGRNIQGVRVICHHPKGVITASAIVETPYRPLTIATYSLWFIRHDSWLVYKLLSITSA